jgi:hypothetical protein
MYLAHPRRLLVFLVLLLLVCFAVWLVFLRGSSTPSLPPASALNPQLHVVKPPPQVAQVLAATAAKPREVVSTKGTLSAASMVHYVDTSTQTAAFVDNGKLVSLVRGHDSWVAGAGGCYDHTTNTGAENTPSLAQQYLPSGSADFHYTYPTSNTLDWTIAATGTTTTAVLEHGALTINARTHVLLAASIYDGQRRILHAVFSYPQQLPALVNVTPKHICKSVPGRILPRPVRARARARAKK